MIQVSGLSKSYGTQVLFEDATFSINPGERLGIVGRNGHGKTTLFRVLVGEEEISSGDIHFPEDYRIGYLSQHLNFTEDTVLKEAALGLPENDEGWQETYRAEAVLQGLGFTSENFSQHPDSFSGGFQVRLNLAKVLVSEPNLLLLDEPTNYLDIVSLRWLVGFMRSWPRELLLITHDHDFMNSVTTHTLGIHRNKIRKFKGGTAKYYEQLELEEEVHEQSRLNQEKKIKKSEEFIRTFRAKASKAKAVQSRVKALERMGSIDKLEEIEDLSFRFTHKPFPGKQLLNISDIAFRYPDQSENLLEGVRLTVGEKDRIGVIGRNGKGKSTFLRLLAGELEPIEGEINPSPNLKLAYFGQTNIEQLSPSNTIEQELLSVAPTLGRTRARTVAGLMMFEGDAALKKIKVLSGGEKSRVLLGRILLTPANLLLLDEPSNHLDMQSNDALLEAVRDFPGAVMLVTHSEMILKAVATRLIVFDAGKVEVFEGGYDDFLRRIGWDEEQGGSSKEEVTNKSQLSKKELRKARAEIVQRRSRELGPLQKENERIEKEIVELEESVAKATEELIELTKDGFSDDAAKLSRELHRNKEKIEELYSSLEQVAAELEQREIEFDKALEELA